RAQLAHAVRSAEAAELDDDRPAANDVAEANGAAVEALEHEVGGTIADDGTCTGEIRRSWSGLKKRFHFHDQASQQWDPHDTTAGNRDKKAEKTQRLPHRRPGARIGRTLLRAFR